MDHTPPVARDAEGWECRDTGAILIHPHDALAILEGRLQSPLIRLGSPSTDSGCKQLAHESEAKEEVATEGDPAEGVASATAETFDILQEDQFDALQAAEELIVAATINAHAAAGSDVLHVGDEDDNEQHVAAACNVIEVEEDGNEEYHTARPAPTQSLDLLLVESQEMVQNLPDQHVVELLAAIERAATPVAQALRFHVHTPFLSNQVVYEGGAGQANRVPITATVPKLDVDRGFMEKRAEAILAVLTERSIRAMDSLVQEGRHLLDLNPHSRSGIANTLADLSHTSPVACLLVQALQQSDTVISEPNRHSFFVDDKERLQDSVDEATLILALVQAAAESGDAVQAQSLVLTTLQTMARNSGSFVASLLHLDLMATCASVADAGRADGSLSYRSRESLGELVLEGAELVQNLEDKDALDMLSSITSGAAASSLLASVLYFQLLLRVEMCDQDSVQSRLRDSLMQSRRALRRLFGEPDDAASRPPSRAQPRGKFRDKKSPRAKVAEEFVESALAEIVLDSVRQEVAEECHACLRTRLTEWSRRLVESKEAVKELEELISHEQRANACVGQVADDAEDGLDESCCALPDTYYTLKLCENDEMDEVVGSVRLEAQTTWSTFREAVEQQLGYSIAHIRYDDDFGPKQAKDIFCSGKTEWKELRDMMEEDQDEIQNILTVQVFAQPAAPARGYRVCMQSGEQSAVVDIEDLKEMLGTCSRDLQTAQKRVLECTRRLKTSWTYCSQGEDGALRMLQAACRASVRRRAFALSRRLVLFAVHIFRPPILRHFQALRFKNRHILSARKVQSAFRGRKARKLAYLATVDAAATQTLMDVVEGFIYSVSEQARAMHKEWIIVDATNAALDLQRVVRRVLIPSMPTLVVQFAKEDEVSYIIVRFFRAIQRRRRFFRSAIAAVMTEDVLFGRAMERAFKELLKESKVQHMQAVFRRIAVQHALQGQVTSASLELATTWAMQDAIIWILHSQDNMYETPRREHATTWLQASMRRSWAREHFGLVYASALMGETTSRRSWKQKDWRTLYDSIKTLTACVLRQKHRQRHMTLWQIAGKVQVRARAMRLVYATRRFKKMVEHLVDVARSNLYRRFYVHTLLVGDYQTSQLAQLADSADLKRSQIAAAKRDAFKTTQAQELVKVEATKSRRRRPDVVSSDSPTKATRTSSAEEQAQTRQKDTEMSKILQLPQQLIFTRILPDAMQCVMQLLCDFVSQQPTVFDPMEGESFDVDWFKIGATCTLTFKDFCDGRLRVYKEDSGANDIEENVLHWLHAHAEGLVDSWLKSESASFLVLQGAEYLLAVWSQQSWIKNPGFLSLELDTLNSVFSAFFAHIKDATMRLETMRNEFPNIAVSAALLQAMQDSCSATLSECGMQHSVLKRQKQLKQDNEQDGEKSEVLQVGLIVQWLKQDHETFFGRVDEMYAEDYCGEFWSQVWSDLLLYAYRTGHVTSIVPLTFQDCVGYIERYASEFESDYSAIETPYETYDKVWTLIFAGQDDYMDTTKEFRWTPDGYALNASSGELVPVDVPDTSSIKSIFSTVHSLSWDFEKEISAKIHQGMRHVHPVGFLGAYTARRRRDRVHMWTALSIETTVCRFLNFAIRISEGPTLMTVLRVLTLLCLRPGRGTLLFQCGCVQLLNSRIVSGQDAEEIKLSSTAAFALQSLLSDAHVASQVDPQSVVAIAQQLKHGVEDVDAAQHVTIQGTMHVSIVYCLQLIIRNNEKGKQEVSNQTWLKPILLKLMRATDGSQGNQAHPGDAAAKAPEGLVASVAMLIAMLSYDVEVCRVFGQDPATIYELILMVRDGSDIVSRQSALTALEALALSNENVDIMVEHEAFHGTLMGILATQSLQLFPLAASLACRFVTQPKMCNVTMQYPRVLNQLLRSMTFSDARISAPATKVLMALTTSIQDAWLLVNSAKHPDAKQLDALVLSAGQVEQFAVNSFAMSTICRGLLTSPPVSQPFAAQAMRAILRCSITACDWVLGNEEALTIIIDGVRHRDLTVQQYCIWSIFDLSARNKGARLLVQRGGWVRLKVLLYTENVQTAAKVAAISCLKHFLLGMDRVAGPDEELILRLADLLRSDHEGVQDACAEILARMIQQDYISLSVKVHAANNCPQSDNWGYCDPFVKLMINDQQHVTPTLRNTLSPVWDDQSHFSISDKNDNLIVQLYDWDNTGAEVLGQIELTCPRLHELGTELGLYRVGHALSEKAATLNNDAELRATTLLQEARVAADALRHNGLEEATKVRDQLLEEARFIGSDGKAEAKKMVVDAAALAQSLLLAAKGQGRVLEFRAEQEALKIKSEAKKKAVQVERVWADTVKDMVNVPARIDLLTKQAHVKSDRLRSQASEEADKMLLHSMKEAMIIRSGAHQESERILSLKQGWHMVMEMDKNGLTGKPLMGFKGDIDGFDDNGKVVGQGGKRLEPSPTVLKINFEYNVNVNVDAIIYDQVWMVPRLFELLACPQRVSLRENVLIILRCLCEDVPMSRRVIGLFPGALELLSSIFATAGLDSCYVEMCKMICLLVKEPLNRMPLHNSLLIPHLKAMRKWKGSEVAGIAAESITKLDQHAQRVRKMEKEKKKEERQMEAATRHKHGAGSPTSDLTTSPQSRHEGSQRHLGDSQEHESSGGRGHGSRSKSSTALVPSHGGKATKTSGAGGKGARQHVARANESALPESGQLEQGQQPVVLEHAVNAEEEQEDVEHYADPDVSF